MSVYNLSRTNWQFNPLVALSLAGAILAIFMVRYGRQQRRRPNAGLFIVAQTLIAVMALAQVIQLSRTDLHVALLASRVQMACVILLPALLLLAVLPVNLWRNRGTFGLTVLLLFVPVCSLYLYLFRSAPNLMLASAAMLPMGHHVVLRLTAGPWFWVHTLYSYSLILAALVLVGERLVHLPAPYRRRPLLVLAGLFLADLVHVGINVSALRGQSSDLMAIATIVGLSVVVWVAFRYNVFDIAPLAREQVLQHLPVGVIALDANGAVLDANLMAISYLGVPLAELVHRPAHEALASLPPLVAALDSTSSSVELDNGGSAPQPYEVTVIPIHNGRGEASGTTLVIRDISAEIEARRRLSELASYIPICAWCGKARMPGGSWEPLATWLRKQGGMIVSHGMCDECRSHYEQDPNWEPPIWHGSQPTRQGRHDKE